MECPVDVTANGQFTNFFAGPYTSDNVGSITSWSFLDGRCTRHTAGYPSKAKQSSTPGISLLVFSDINVDAGGLESYEAGQQLIMVTDGVMSVWTVDRALNENTILIEDSDNYWPHAEIVEVNGVECVAGVTFFLELQPQRNINTTTGEDTSVERELDGFVWTYALAASDQSLITTPQPLYTILSETFVSATQTFYIWVEGRAPGEFNVDLLPPPENPISVGIYHGKHSFAYDAPEGPVPSGAESDCVGLDCADPFYEVGGVAIEPEVCEAENLYNPYAQNKSVNLYKQLNNIVSNIFGHTVNYFRTEANDRTKDVTLMEYSLFSVADQQDIKILVPDNEFPEEANTYNIFGMEWAEFEVHIVHDRFKAVFGEGIRPRSKDYLFIPIINKMYEVSSVSIADEFNASRSYWRLKLTKYQDRTSVIKGQYETATDDLITGIDELFGEEIADEQKQDTKPVQFQTISRVLEDGSRTYIDSNLTIVDEAIVNNFQTVSHNHYDLSRVSINSDALRYATSSNMIVNGQIAVTGWFRPTFEITDSNKYSLIGDNLVQGGIQIKISTLKISVVIDGNDHEFTHNTSLSKDKWYGIVVNIKNNTEQVELKLFSLTVNGHVSSLVEEYHNTFTMIGGQHTWGGLSPYVLKGSKLNVTSLRIFDKAIEEDEMVNMLNQYVVYDNQHALVIDNAIPSLGYQKFKNAR